MGVDVGIKVRVYQKNSNDFKEISVSDQDNSLGSIFYANEIGYTSIKFNRKEELTEEENSTIDLHNDEEEEMLSCSTITEAVKVLEIFDKVHRKMYRLQVNALVSDLSQIDSTNSSNEDKEKQKSNQIREYFGFVHSLSTFIGILKTAKEENAKIQIVAEYY